MNRVGVLTWGGLTLFLGMAFTAVAAASMLQEEPQAAFLKALIHINFDGDARQEGGLRNIEAILAEVGDTGAEIEVVCHSDGIGLVVSGQSPHTAAIEALQKRGVRFVACRNTMRRKSIEPDQLVTGVGIVPSGAVEVLRRQQEGYSYFRP